jgi:hypothetical protein
LFYNSLETSNEFYNSLEEIWEAISFPPWPGILFYNPLEEIWEAISFKLHTVGKDICLII